MKNSVRIGSLDYEIVEDNTLSACEGCLGMISYAQTRISIYPNTSDQRKAAALMHEIVHGILTDGKCNDCFESSNALERSVEILALGLVGVLRDNRELVREIYKMIDSEEE
jgi:Zn-dependent peptidase ImmA (M78 family)